MLKKLTKTKAPPATILIRIMVGAVFISEGIQKFIRADEVGAGRFERIGLPQPQVLAPVVGVFEVLCGALVLIGLLTRPAVVPLLVIMGVAIWQTKVPILESDGFWEMAHASRNDFCMVMGSLFLLWVGAGKLSVDKKLGSPKPAAPPA
ncbi:MAG: DoxX family protein [Phycisphaerales bacterium]|nr:MAG: DoxX family protein [Phycisphaerales bacterium]